MKVIIYVVMLASLITPPIYAQDADHEYDQIRHESVVYYKRKMVLEASNKDIEKVPKWDGLDINKLPISSEAAIKKAATFLKELGYKDNEFFLVEISMIKVDRLKGVGDWYWKVAFADDSLAVSARAVITIPVLLDGNIPKPKYEKLEQGE